MQAPSRESWRHWVWIAGLALGSWACSTEPSRGTEAERRAAAKPAAAEHAEPSASPLPAELEAKIVFLMTQEEMGSRVAIDPLVELSKDIEVVVSGLYARKEIAVVPLSVVVGVKPGGRMKVWAVGIDGPLKPEDEALI